MAKPKRVRVTATLFVDFEPEDHKGLAAHEIEDRAAGEVRAQLRTGHECAGYHQTTPANEVDITARLAPEEGDA